MITRLELPCGCEVTVDHTGGDRGLTCACELKWIVRAVRVNRVTYQVDPWQGHEGS